MDLYMILSVIDKEFSVIMIFDGIKLGWNGKFKLGWSLESVQFNLNWAFYEH